MTRPGLAVLLVCAAATAAAQPSALEGRFDRLLP